MSIIPKQNVSKKRKRETKKSIKKESKNFHIPIIYVVAQWYLGYDH